MRKLIIQLKNLKKMGVVGIKQSLEDEGATFDDIKKMKKITLAAKLDLNVKIGGCEAKNDIFFCKKIGVNSIVAPMVESEYALKKFAQCAGAKKNNLLLINLETNLSLTNLNKIIKSKSFKVLDGVVIGRSDLAGSLNMEKKDVDSLKIFKKVFNAFKKISRSNKKRMICKMGGSITPNSTNFINKLYLKKLLHRIETRNVEIKLSKNVIKNLDKVIIKAFEFELEWLRFKSKSSEIKKNKLLFKDYALRIKEIDRRLKNYI